MVDFRWAITWALRVLGCLMGVYVITRTVTFAILQAKRDWAKREEAREKGEVV